MMLQLEKGVAAETREGGVKEGQEYKSTNATSSQDDQASSTTSGDWIMDTGVQELYRPSDGNAEVE